MSDSVALSNPNELVSSSVDLLDALRSRETRIVLLAIGALEAESSDQGITAHRISAALGLPEASVTDSFGRLAQAELVSVADDHVSLTPRGLRWASRVLTDMSKLVGSSVGGALESSTWALQGQYLVQEEIGRGATSVTFRVEHLMTHSVRAMKVFYPGYVTIAELSDALEVRQRISNAAIPAVLDAGTISGSRFKMPEDLVCLVQDLVVDALTFEEFLTTQFYSPPHLLERFIREVGGALLAIHDVGLQHGDLHSNNILVSSDRDDEPRFHVVDFAGVAVKPTPNTETIDDDEYFIQHLLRAAVIAHAREPSIPMRRLVGERVFRILSEARDGNIDSVADLLALLDAPLPSNVNLFTPARVRPFEWLRVESVPTHADLLRLFEPSQGRFREISEFGNTWISGPRGCGKSHYVRVLAFFPDLERARLDGDESIDEEYERLGLDFRSKFGVLIPCRVGTFKSLTPAAMGRTEFTVAEERLLKDILVLAIVNETVAALIAGGPVRLGGNARSPLGATADMQPLWNYWRERVPRSGMPGSPLAQLEQVQEEVAGELLLARNKWFVQPPTTRAVFEDADLVDFFDAVGQSYEQLGSTRFQIIFDDVTHGIVHLGVQRVLNSLVRSAGERHCYKLTCERYQYTLDSIDGRAIEFPHDASFVDLGELAVGAMKDAPSSGIAYMRAVVNRRLRLADWPEEDVVSIVGKSVKPSVFLARLRQAKDEPVPVPDWQDTAALHPPNEVAEQPQSPPEEPAADRAHYAGWNVLCHLAHGSVRNMLEMLEAIFGASNIGNARGVTGPIDSGLQDRALREYSLRHWRELQNLPGRMGPLRIGPQLQSVAGAVGEISRRLLLYYEQTSTPYEAISFERLDPDRPLSDEAEAVLDAALRYGVFMAAGANFSRAHRGLTTRFDLNKMYAPAFRTTYRVRNHIFLTGGDFEELLLRPGRWTQRRARVLAPEAVQEELPWQR